ncbi:arylamine N-acetyltransferase [Vibrio cholerae]
MLETNIFKIDKYLKRIGLFKDIDKSLESIEQLQNAHFYSVPFENLEMRLDEESKLELGNIYDRIVENKKGGLCFEFCLLLEEVFKHYGVSYSPRLARLHQPYLTGCTHQLFVLDVDNEKFIFDVGFGAKGPRGVLKLENGYVFEHEFNSSKVTYDEEFGWCVFSREFPNENWELLYSFFDNKIRQEDIEISYFYIKNSPDSLLNKNRVISIPLPRGRKSIRNYTMTIINGDEIKTIELDESNIINEIKREFGLDVIF